MGVIRRIENPSRESRGTSHEVERHGNWGDVFVVIVLIAVATLIIGTAYHLIIG